jgi:archaetidylinositol phosphate synthase
MESPTPHHLNEGLLQPLERPALQWLAARLPSWMTPDHLTLIGLAGAFIVFLGYALSSVTPGFLWLANFGLIVHWFGDSLDGTLARFRKIERPRYGYLVDHTTDLLSEVMFALGFGLSSFVRFETASLALNVMLLISVFTFIKAQISGMLEISFFGIGGTELRIGMIVLNIAMFLFPPKPIVTLWAPLTLADLTVLTCTALAFVFFLVALWREARLLAHEYDGLADRKLK